MCSAFNSSTGHCALRPRPHFIRYRQVAACPRAAQKTQTYRSLRFPAVAALVPSAGTITLQIELRSDAGAVSTPHPLRVRAGRGRGSAAWAVQIEFCPALKLELA